MKSLSSKIGQILPFNLLACLAAIAIPAQAATYTLGTTNLVVGPGAGTNSVVLAVAPATNGWTAAAGATWIHLGPSNRSGAGSTNVIFSYDANPGATRFGQVSIGSASLTLTQAGATYVEAATVGILVPYPEESPVGATPPSGMAVDKSGNAYTMLPSPPGAEGVPCVIDEWRVTNNAATTYGTGFSDAMGVAVDSNGKVYVADTDNGAIKVWNPSNGLISTVVSNLSFPTGVAVDEAGNIFIAEIGNNAISMWNAAASNLTRLVSSNLSAPQELAVDAADNVYITDTGNNCVKEWLSASGAVITLASNLVYPVAVAVDGSGNVYIAEAYDYQNGAGADLLMWTAATGAVTTVIPQSLGVPANGLAVDSTGNVYMSDFPTGYIDELTHAFVDTAPKLLSPLGGTDSLAPVLPVTENLLAPFAPGNDSPEWLTITGVANGAVGLSFGTDGRDIGSANVTVLGQTVQVTQGVAGVAATLTGAQALAGGGFQFGFTNIVDAYCEVLGTTNLNLPLTKWTTLGAATEISPGQFKFISEPGSNQAQWYYTIRTP